MIKRQLMIRRQLMIKGQLMIKRQLMIRRQLMIKGQLMAAVGSIRMIVLPLMRPVVLLIAFPVVLLIAFPIVLPGTLGMGSAMFVDKKQSKAEAWASALGEAPAEAASRPNPYDGQPGAVEAGRKLFRRHCDECHGSEALGTAYAPALRSAAVQGAAPGTLYWFLTNGNLKRGMPSWSRLPGQRRWQLVCYLKSLEPPRF
jgi:cytochrome c oxidase cbb3-type subunit 2